MALVAGTGLAVAATLRLRDLPRLILGAYVVGFAEVVGLILLLSAFEAVTRAAILVAVAGLFAASVAGWFLSGAPGLPPVSVGRLRALKHTPIVLVLAVVSGLALVYVLALIVGTPPNNPDSLTYHLARAAFWSQENGIHYIADAYDERLNAHPPNAEIVLTFLLEVGQNERLTGFVQFIAAFVTALGVFALARELRLGRREAAFGALLFLTLPIVLLQASTAQNDLVAVSLLIAATVFLLGDTRRELVLVALATALAISTKVPAAYGVPILGALALMTPPSTYRKQRVAAVVAGAVVGSYWYIVNLVQTGNPLGDISEKTKLVALLEPTENFLGGYARLIDAFDLSGAVQADILVYALAAFAVVMMLLIGARKSRTQAVRPALLTGALVSMPITFVPIGYALWRVFAKLHDVLDAPDGFLPVKGWGARTLSSDTISWFGPVGFLLVVGLGAASIVLVRRRFLPPVALVFGAAPLVWFVLIALSLAYDPTQGRFFMFPVALSASLWGLILRTDRFAIAAVAIASTTATLSLVNFYEKPSGLRLLERDPQPIVVVSYLPPLDSVWGVERWEAQSLAQLETRNSLRFLAELPSDATVALALRFNDLGYPAFGAGLDRYVDLIPFGSNARVSDAEWLLATPQRAHEINRACWRVVRATREGWVGFRRRPGACGL